MDNKEYKEIIEALANLVDEGIHIVDAEGKSIVYSEAIAVLEKVRREDVLGKSFRETFSHIPKGESTLLQALQKGQATKYKQQTFLNLYGKEVTTMNSTIPIKVGGKIVAAIEIAKDITEIKSMSDKILELQEEFLAPPKLSQPKIRHYNFYDIVGRNKAFSKTIDLAKKAAKNKTSVFVYGETGTGKELFAQSIHYDGVRRVGPFLAQNCAAIPESLLEGILFGTTKGGFTGATDRAGLFEQANGGTLLLDEVSAMPYELQSKLLRVLQEDYIRRIGGTKDIPVDVKIIATVNETPEKLISAGALRKDLFYRLSTISLSIPPLRRRKDDIPLIAERLLEKHSKKLMKKVGGLTDGALKVLQSHDYPGNIRELENIIMAAVSMADEKEEISEDHIIVNALGIDSFSAGGNFLFGEDKLDSYLAKVEKDILEEIMEAKGKNISKAADALGIKRQTLQHKLKKYGM